MYKLLPNLYELVLNNLSITGGKLDGKTVVDTTILDILFHEAFNITDKLMKLKLTKMNLRNDALIQDIG